MITGTTSSGFNFEIDENIKKDWRFVRTLSKLKDIEESDSAEVDFINTMAELEQILFADKGKAFEKHLAKCNNGNVPTDILLQEMLEIIKSEPLKNS